MPLLTQIEIRRDTAANWATANPVLLNGEFGLETDTGNLRIGDGSSNWAALTSVFKRINVRTLSQLGGTPTSTDIAMGAGALFTSTDNILRYINAAGTAYLALDVASLTGATAAAATAAANAQTTASAAVPSTQKGAANGVATLGSGSKVPVPQLTGQLATTDLTDGAALNTAVANKQSIALSWNGTTPALSSGTNPVTAGFGSNCFVYTGSGTSPTLDGLSGVNGDLFIFAGAAWTKVSLGGGYVGSYSSTANLQTAYPAASNPACIALVTGVIYISNGTAWQIKVQASTDLSDGATLNAQIATNTAAAVQITGNVTITTANQATYNGKILEWTGAYTVTVSAGLANDFGFAGIPPASGNASIASDGTAQLNGATSTLTRAYATNPMFTVTQRGSNRNQYVMV